MEENQSLVHLQQDIPLLPRDQAPRNAPVTFPAPGFNAEAKRISIQQRVKQWSQKETTDSQGLRSNLSKDIEELLDATSRLGAYLQRERGRRWALQTTM